MCGIAGHVGPEPPDAYEQTVRAMVQALVRRGPDSEGVAKWPNAVLGHRRLAILDLSEAGHQPMLSDDGQIGLVFNGCIYNFLELRRDLEQRGHRFRSRCDTEVLLRGYEEWGIDALAGRLRGMFAFGIWDQRRRTLTLVRDRLGVKPLIYSQRSGEIGFASTIGALACRRLWRRSGPRRHHGRARVRLGRRRPLDLRRHAQTAPGQHFGVARRRASRERQYWTLPAGGESSQMTFEEAVEETERLLVESVKLRLIADVPIGVLLSGGIDSALVCWATRELNANLTAFTVRAPGDASDESADAAYTAKVLGIPHEIVEMPDTDFSLDELVDAYSEPFACQSAQATLWVCAGGKAQGHRAAHRRRRRRRVLRVPVLLERMAGATVGATPAGGGGGRVARRSKGLPWVRPGAAAAELSGLCDGGIGRPRQGARRASLLRAPVHVGREAGGKAGAGKTDGSVGAKPGAGCCGMYSSTTGGCISPASSCPRWTAGRCTTQLKRAPLFWIRRSGNAPRP